jgi:hypothetical protein
MSAPEDHALAALLRDLVDDLGSLVVGHLRLACAALAADARAYERRAAFVGLAGALLLVGYALACVATSLALAPRLGAPLAFAVVGGVHLVGAGVGLGLLLGRATATVPALDESLAALDRTVATLSTGANGARRPATRPQLRAPHGIGEDGLA